MVLKIEYLKRCEKYRNLLSQIGASVRDFGLCQQCNLSNT